MRSLLASLRTLILPFGQIGGPRIVLDGTTGTIEIYDGNNDLVAVLGELPGLVNQSGFQVNEPGQPLGATVALTSDPDPRVWFYTGDVAESVPGSIKGNINGVGGARTMSVEIRNPSFDGTLAGIDLVSGSQDGSADPYVNIDQTDFRIEGNSVGRGVLSYVPQTGLDTLAAGVEELVNVLQTPALAVEANRLYAVSGKLSFSNVTTRVSVRLRYTTDGSAPTDTDSVVPHGTYVCNTTATGLTGGSFPFKGIYTPAVTGQFRVGIFAIADAGIDAIVASDQDGYIMVEDIGA